MAAGTVGYTDTRSFSGSLLGDIAKGIGSRVKGAAQMARSERENAAKALNVGGREDGITKQEFDKEYGKGYFFKRALGSYFGGDRIARTRGYFEKNPPAGRDPTGTRESRFSAGFDYASKEGLIKSARPLQGPIAPEYLYSYDKRYADVLGDAAKFKDDSLDKDKIKAQTGMFSGTSSFSDTRSFGGGKDKNAIPVEDKELNEKIASSLSGIEIQMTKLESKMNSGEGDDGEVSSLVSANSKAIVAGFTGIHAALSSLLGATQKQTQAIRDGAQKKNIAEEKAEDKENRAAEEFGAEGQDGGVGTAGVSKLGEGDGGGGFWGGLLGGLFDLFSGRGLMRGRGRVRALGRLGRMKGKAFLGRAAGGMKGIGGRLLGPAAAVGMELAFPPAAGGYDQLRGPNAYYNRPGYSRPKFYGGGSFGGGAPVNIQVGDTPKGIGEAIIPMSPQTFADSAKARLELLKKNKKFYSGVQTEGMQKFFNSDKGWKSLGQNLWEGIKSLFGVGDGNEDPSDADYRRTHGSMDPVSLKDFSEKEVSDLGRMIYAEAGSDQEGAAHVMNAIFNRYRQIKSGMVTPKAWGISGKTKEQVTLTDILMADNQFQPVRDGRFDKVSADQGTQALNAAISGGGLDPNKIKENLVQSGKTEADAAIVATADSFYNPELSSNKPFRNAPAVATSNKHAFMASPVGYKPGDLSKLAAFTQETPPAAPEVPAVNPPGEPLTPEEKLMSTVSPSFIELKRSIAQTNENLKLLTANPYGSAAAGLTLATPPTNSTTISTGIDWASLGLDTFTPAPPGK
jgi:hypothetical protein